MKTQTRSNLHSVEPFAYSFVLNNRQTGQQWDFVALRDVLNFVRRWGRDCHTAPYLPHRFSLLPRLTLYEKERFPFTGPNWCVRNNLGRAIECHELEEHMVEEHMENIFPVWWIKHIVHELEPEGVSTRLIRTKGAPHKIKSTYQHTRHNTYCGMRFRPQINVYRHVRTFNERKQTLHHTHQWGEEFPHMFRCARKKLPTYYDDIVVSTRKTQKSWKHHSKRRKQWISE